eukprot:TRINITY_DN10878_c0_g1_i1.p1 TRINITY_DN10878_c0_g1~~TRINITY_DN10878_c0_g1_i1.p1  ORF type:complete len:166 (+),score=8.04 TRINITY_DN10878_c0_g1_i1:78-575(+)
MEKSGSFYEQECPYSVKLKIILGLVPIVIIAMMLFVVIIQDGASIGLSLFLIAEAIFILLIYWFMLPRKLIITDTEMIVVLGPPLKFRVNLLDIVKVTEGNIFSGFFTMKWKFTTCATKIVYIERSVGWNVKVSPSDPAAFVSELNRRIALAYELSQSRSLTEIV